MSEMNSVKYYTPEAEIDVRESARNLIRYVRKNIKTLLVYGALGLVAGYAAFRILPPNYEVKMIADSRMLSSQVVISIVDSWQELLKKNERTLLARKMNLSPQVVATLTTIEAEPNEITRATAQDRSAFIISADVSSTALVDSLQKGILYYLENSQYMQERTQSEKRRLQLLKNRIEQEIAQLDTVKSSLQSMLKRGGSASGAFISEPGNVNAAIVELYDQLLTTNQSLEFVDNIQVISGFDRVEHPSSPKLSICLLGGLVLGLLAAVVSIFLRSL